MTFNSLGSTMRSYQSLYLTWTWSDGGSSQLAARQHQYQPTKSKRESQTSSQASSQSQQTLCLTGTWTHSSSGLVEDWSSFVSVVQQAMPSCWKPQSTPDTVIQYSTQWVNQVRHVLLPAVMKNIPSYSFQQFRNSSQPHGIYFIKCHIHL